MGSITLGPVVLPADMVLLLVTVVLAMVTAKLLQKRLATADIEPLIWRVLVLSLIATRLGFVLEFAVLYAATPLEVLNIRDGGWEPVAGWTAAWAFTAWLAWRRPLQRRTLGAALLVATVVWWGGGWALQQTGGTPAARLPDLALTTLDLQPRSLASYAGKPVVLNLWASWCGPCQREMPTLQRAQQRYPGVQFVFANQGESVEKVERYLALKGLALDHMLLDRHGQVARHFQQRALPTTFFFDADGTLVDTRTGELSDATLAQRLARWPQGAAAVAGVPATTMAPPVPAGSGAPANP